MPWATLTRTPPGGAGPAAEGDSDDGATGEGAAGEGNATGTAGATAREDATPGAAGSPSLAEAAGESGTLGPSLTPARRGQATPTTNPTTATAPTPNQEGRSWAGEGSCTVSGPSALRRGIERTITIGVAARRKRCSSGGPPLGMDYGRTTSSRNSVPPS